MEHDSRVEKEVVLNCQVRESMQGVGQNGIVMLLELWCWAKDRCWSWARAQAGCWSRARGPSSGQGLVPPPRWVLALGAQPGMVSGLGAASNLVGASNMTANERGRSVYKSARDKFRHVYSVNQPC